MVNLVYCLFTFLAYEYSRCNLMCSLITITISVVLFFFAIMDKDGSLVHQNRGVNSDSTGVPLQLHRTHHMKCPVLHEYIYIRQSEIYNYLHSFLKGVLEFSSNALLLTSATYMMLQSTRCSSQAPMVDM